MGNKFFAGAGEDDSKDLLGAFGVLPSECINEILLYCDKEDLGNLACVNSMFRNEVAADNRRWQQIFIEEYGFPSQLQDHSEEEVDALPWMELYCKKSCKQRDQSQPATQSVPLCKRLWSATEIALCVLGHALIVPLMLLLLVPIVLSLSHRTVVILRYLLEALDELWCSSEARQDALHFRETSESGSKNLWLQFYSDIIAQFLYLLFDLACFVTLPFLSGLLCMATVYRLPLLVRKLWQSPRKELDSDASLVVMEQAYLCIVDFLVIVFLGIPLLVTIHRLPTLWRKLRAEDYLSLVGDNKLRAIFWEELKSIAHCEPSEKDKLIASIVAA